MLLLQFYFGKVKLVLVSFIQYSMQETITIESVVFNAVINSLDNNYE